MEENNPVPKATILDDAVTVHRIGGGATENLVLKSREETLNPPGISVLEAAEPQSVAFQMRTAFPKATVLHELSRTIGSAKVGTYAPWVLMLYKTGQSSFRTIAD